MMARFRSPNAADPFRRFGVVYEVEADLTGAKVIIVRAAEAATTTGRPRIPQTTSYD
jgi:hypothetical protein